LPRRQIWRAGREFHDELVRVLLVPLEPGLRAVDADVEVVLVADADLRGVQHALRAALVAHEDVAVVVELAALHEGREVGAERIDVQAGDVAREVFGVRADVAHAAGGAAALRVGAPAACFWPVASSRVESQPCGYSTTTLRIGPSAPLRTSSRACFTIGLPV
jgi:hypothetical protein